ncbi:hypothetical protein GOP47_0022812 [Adiantum capillus-veneris]|uniref:Protein HIRA n=1 Tax=Adiantum capillus-veneris TaxID=13818 RepID=A0A9D4Z4M9_ADICA|nr:hypothetical protein GOP47_0022812 [Adiantum capillus-veneris]
MIVEKPAWLRHEGLQIFSIDIQPTGHRFATAGGDHKVRIWDMKYLSRVEADTGSAPLHLLATLRDHFGSVNCVRWSKQGRLIASGSDDQIVLIHERRSGSGTTEFGSGEAPDVENWKVLLTLRGHTADVVDLCWCSDDSLLASCSLDNTIHIWNMSNGSQVTILKGHTSLVKGIAWDPVGSFLASQSDDKTVIIWRASDWNLAQRLEGHWEKTVGSTFFRRLDWSPCGHFITTTNGFQKPRHSAPVLERGDWAVSYDFLGHNAPIVAVKFNQSLFCKQPQRDIENGKLGLGGEHGLANGSVKQPTSKDSLAYNVIAMGSQDCSITVWTTTSVRPVFVGKHFFTQSVVDLSWSPDGYSLFCCSLDGSVAAFHFEVKELGYKFSEAEMEDLKKKRYGDSRGRQTTLAESPAQLLLESVAAKKWGVGDVQPPVKARPEQSVVTNDIDRIKLPITSPPANPADKVSEQGLQSVSAGPVVPPPAESQPKRVSSPIKQREYRRPDGRRRIIPEPVGPQVRDERIDMNGVHLAQTALSGQKRDATSLENVDLVTAVKGGRREVLLQGGVAGTNAGTTAKASASSFARGAELCSIDATGIGTDLSSVQRDVVVNADGHSGKGVLSISVSSKEDAGSGLPLCFEARLLTGGSASTNTHKTEVVCSQGGEVKWRDKLTGKATVISGNSNMWAVGCQDGTLQVYTKAGRRAMPSIMVGSAPVFMDFTENSRLLLLTRHGALYMWDCLESSCLLKESVLPLLAISPESVEKGSVRIVSVQVSKSGAPLVVLANRHAFLFHMDMQCWQRVADDQFHASSFFSSLQGTSLAGDSELASLQAAAAEVAASNRKWNRVMNEDKSTTRSHLESQMASAIALKSPQDYQNFLLAYTRFLTREADEVRLRELCMELLGPPFPNDTAMDGSNATTEGVSKWESTVLGLKKQELLKSHVLPAMASNRSIQRLLNEVLDLVSELEARQQALNDSKS